MNIAIFGAGAWGTAMALHASRHGHTVTLVPRRMEQALEISSSRVNREYLADFPLPVDIQIGCEVGPALMEAELVLLACPSSGLRELCHAIRSELKNAWQVRMFVGLCKGLEVKSFLNPSQVIREELPGFLHGILSGPTFAAEVATGKPSAVVLASPSESNYLREVQAALSGPDLRVYRSMDMLGVELGGCLKNVYAIGAGICDGLQLGCNAKAAYVTRALHELVRLGLSMGGNTATFYGLSGVGDLVATCYAPLSRNHTFGNALGDGTSVQTALEQSKGVVEGYRATECFYSIGCERGVDVPILNALYGILFDEKDPAKAVAELMSRELKEEV